MPPVYTRISRSRHSQAEDKASTHAPLPRHPLIVHSERRGLLRADALSEDVSFDVGDGEVFGFLGPNRRGTRTSDVDAHPRSTLRGLLPAFDVEIYEAQRSVDLPVADDGEAPARRRFRVRVEADDATQARARALDAFEHEYGEPPFGQFSTSIKLVEP